MKIWVENMGSVIVIWDYDHCLLSTTEEPGTGLDCEAIKMKNSHFSWDPHKLCCEAQKGGIRETSKTRKLNINEKIICQYQWLPMPSEIT